MSPQPPTFADFLAWIDNQNLDQADQSDLLITALDRALQGGDYDGVAYFAERGEGYPVNVPAKVAWALMQSMPGIWSSLEDVATEMI